MQIALCQNDEAKANYTLGILSKFHLIFGSNVELYN